LHLSFPDRRYYYLMYLLSQRLAPCVAVELGVERGDGLASLALGSPDTLVFGVDQAVHGALPETLAEFPDITFLHARSTPVPDELHVFEINILHVDTIHSYAQVTAEWQDYQPFLAQGAIVLFDDLHVENVAQKFYELPHPKRQDDRLHRTGYGVLLYCKEQRQWTDR
jgi:cephalosporin hydroxylase